MVPVALIDPLDNILPPVILPVVLTAPPAGGMTFPITLPIKFAPVTLPVTLTDVPRCEGALTDPLTLTLVPVITPPTTLAPL